MRSDLTMIIKRVARAVLFSVTATTSATTISTTNTKFNNRVLASLLSSTSLSSSLLLTRTLITCVGRKIPASCPPSAPVDGLLASPSWSFYQRRGSKVLGSEVSCLSVLYVRYLFDFIFINIPFFYSFALFLLDVTHHSSLKLCHLV